jgi:hypothetical protein
VKNIHTLRKRKARQRSGRRFSLIRCLLLACLLAGPALRLFAADPVSLDVAIMRITEPRSPFMVGDELILTAMPEAARWVGARLDFVGVPPGQQEHFTVLRPFARNEHGVFVLDIPVPEGVTRVRYRLVVDGLWMSDPNSQDQELDELGNTISVYTLEREPVRPVVNPKAEEGGRIGFVFKGDPGIRVSLAGDFNNWDPFVDYLRETEPGVYRISLRVGRGPHFYYFFSEGRKILDQFNPDTGQDPDGNPVSFFRFPPRPPESPSPGPEVIPVRQGA